MAYSNYKRVFIVSKTEKKMNPPTPANANLYSTATKNFLNPSSAIIFF